MSSSFLILWGPLLLLSSIFPSIRDFSNESSIHIRWPKYWSFRFIISPSVNWSPLRLTGLISLLSKGLSEVFNTTVQRHQFFGILPCFWSNSHNCTWPTGKTIALTIQTFVSRVMPLLFNILFRFVIAFLPRRNHHISWMQSTSAVILEPKKRKSVTTSTFSPSICHSVMRPDVVILVFFF